MEILFLLLFSFFTSNSDLSKNATYEISAKSNPKNVGNTIVDDLNGLIR